MVRGEEVASEIDWTDDENDSDGSVYDSSSFVSSSYTDSDDNSHSDVSSSSDGDSSFPHHDKNQHRQKRSLWHDEGVARFVSSLRRRVAPPSISKLETSDNMSGSRSRAKRKHHPRHTSQLSAAYSFIFKEKCPRRWSRIANLALVVSLFVWVFTQITHKNRKYNSPIPLLKEPPLRRGLTKDQMDAMRNARKIEAIKSLGSATTSRGIPRINDHLWKGKDDNNKRSKVAEVPPLGCEATAWQTKSFPTCNEIHEIDLLDALGLSGRNHNFMQDLNPGLRSNRGVTAGRGYVGSGLYRSVWKVDPRGDSTKIEENGERAQMVLKIMKGEQEFDVRNLDRHRRDALVMERLTHVPNVVSAFGFCGTTLLTEYAGVGLDKVIYEGYEVERIGDILAEEKHRRHTRRTPLGRLHLALDVARGLASAHSLVDGAIIHADIQAKQFLVDPRVGVKMNDFNRCRLIPQSVKTGMPCKVKIPSAPGSARSPEEYQKVPLTQQIDVYSAAHIIFGILTGQRPAVTTRVDRVDSGKVPTLTKNCCDLESDAALASLMRKAYEYNPLKRIKATQLLSELELLVTHEEARTS